MKARTVAFPIAFVVGVSLLAPEVNGQAEVTTVAALNVFFQGANGELIDAHWDGGDWFWGAHGLPPDGTRMDSAPAVLSVQSESNWWVLNVFFKGSNGQPVERDWEAMPGRWSWAAPHGLPPDGTQMDSAPAAIAWATTAYIVRNVYFKGANGQLYEHWQQQGQPWQWFAHGLPPGGTLMASAPAAIHWQTQDGTHQQDVFFQGKNGELIEAYWDSSGWQWVTDHGLPPGTQMASAPAAISTKTSAGVPVRHVFLAGGDGQLYERWKVEGQPWQWFAHGLPPDGAQIVSAPAAVPWNYQGIPRKNVFFQGSNGEVVGRYWDEHQGWQWDGHNAPHGLPPGGTRMASAPAAIAYRLPAGYWWQNIFFQGANGALIEAYWDSPGEGDWFWGKQHDAPPGTLMVSAPAIGYWRKVVVRPPLPDH
jgi:hypothetical protein